MINDLGKLYAPNSFEVYNMNAVTRGETDEVEAALACPSNTVYGSSWNNDGQNSTGSMCADSGREGKASVFYQSITANLYKVSGIRFYGVFSYWNPDEGQWIYCNERGGADENGICTEPVRMRIGFHKMGKDLMPTDTLYMEEFDIIPQHTGVVIGDHDSGDGYIYSFEVDLGQDILLESGYVSITAVDMGDKPSCWFNMFTTRSAQGFGLVNTNGDEWMQAFAPGCVCLTGTGEMSAKKAVKLERFLSPKSYSDGKYEKVAVEISNAGSYNLKDVTLELWKNDELICTDVIDQTIDPVSVASYDGKYKHVFSKRVDCSTPGDNVITVKNVTPNDEYLCDAEDKLTVNVYKEGDVAETHAKQFDYVYITNVKMGDIDNASEGSAYSDFRDIKTNIHPGDILDLHVETATDATTGVWIDWNGNGNFGDTGEFCGGLDYDGNLYISYPVGQDMVPGDKTMRIASTTTWNYPVYSGEYDYGETEDYTVTVVREAGTPGFKTNTDMIEVANAAPQAILKVSNEGEDVLESTVKLNYILPGSPDGLNIAHSAAEVPQDLMGLIKTAHITSDAPAPVKDAKTEYVLGYDRGQYDCITMAGEEAIFGQLYPQKMLKDLEGMYISSVDVYIGDVPGKSMIEIYQAKPNSNMVGTPMIKKAFFPKNNRWARIELDEPVAITGDEGLIVAVKMAGFKEDKYYMGIDNGSSVVGYGDLAGFNGYWWSMADLQINKNYCIRANVSGKRTPAISWLNIDKQNLSLSLEESADLNVNYLGTQLDGYLYSAVLEFQNNDPMRSLVRVPIYLVNDATGIISADLGDSEITYENDEIKVVSSKKIFNISIYDVKGQLVDNIDPEEGETVISTLNYDKGIYILSVMYADGNRQGVKIPVVK